MDTKKNYLRKILTFTLSVLLVIQGIIISPQNVYATLIPITSHDGLYEYTFTNNNATITKYKGPQNTTINIPEKIDDAVSVIAIGENAFIDATWMKNLILPSTLRNIGISAFENIGIEELVIPGNVSNISTMAFYGCQSLKSIYILHGIQTIGDAAFADCINLEKIAMPRSLKDMSKRSLQGNTTEMQADADTYAASKYIAQGATITKSDLPNNSPVPYEYGIASDGSVVIKSYQGLNVNPEIPNEINGRPVKHIGDNAFNNEYGHNIETVKLPDSLLTIGSNAFAGTKLTSVIIPDSVTAIGEKAFDDKKDLTLKGSCEALLKYLKNMHNIIFELYGPGAVTYKKVSISYIPYGTIIGIKAEEYKTGTVMEIELVQNLKGYSFENWTSTVEGVFEDEKNKVTKFTMPDKDVTIGVKFSKDEIRIEHGVVLGYNGTNEFEIPEQWEEEKPYNNTLVPTKEIKSITNEIWSTSYNRGGPRILQIPYTVERITDGLFNTKCYNLEAINVDKNNQNFSSENGVLFNKDKTRLIRYPSRKKDSSYTIPSTVKTIDPYAFYGCVYLESITLPNTITSIGKYTFSGCTKLKSINIPQTVTSIGEYAFESCNRLESINIPNIVTFIGEYAFSNCSSLKAINIPNNIKLINNNVFLDCTSLETVNIAVNNNVLTDIGNYAFSGCTSLKTINLPDSLETIGHYAFRSCKSLTSISISDNLNSIGNYAFSDCTTLETINISNTIKGLTIGEYAFNNCIALTTMIIPKNVSTINPLAFLQCLSLTSIKVDAENPSYMDKDGVLYSKNEKSLILYPISKPETTYNTPNTIDTIEQYAFSKNKFLQSIDMSNSTELKTIKNNAFSSASVLSEVKFSTQIESIGESTFSDCTGLVSISIPNNLTNISNSMFARCSNLETITIPNSVKTIGNYAFSDCAKLKNVPLLDSVETIGANAFENCSSITNISFPNSVKNINSKAFTNCTGLTSIEFSNGETNINSNAFEKCTELATVDFGSNKVSIGNSAFANNSKLANVVFSNGVKSIGEYAFNNCKMLSSITIPNSVTNIGKGSFIGCSNLTSVEFSNDATNSSEIIIGESAFSGCVSLSNIEFSSNVKSIGKNAFASCIGLETVKFLDGGTNANGTVIGESAFSGCTLLSNVEFSNNVKSIAQYAFDKCEELTSIAIKQNIESIADKAFINCTKLSNITVDTNNRYFYSDGIGLYNNNKTNFILYANAAEQTEYTLLDSVTVINSYAFSNSKKLTKVKLPLALSTIKEYAFLNCEALDNIDISDNITLIEKYAFSNCINLKEVIIRAKGKDLKINENIFNKINSLVLKGYMGSSVEEYAYKYSNVEFVALDEVTAGLIVEDSVLVGYTGTDTNIVLSSDIKTISSKAFYKPDNINKTITSIVIPLSVNTIEEYAFYGCNGLTKISVPKSVTNIGKSAFKDCVDLEEIVVNSENPSYSSSQGVLMDKYRTKIKEVPDAFKGPNKDGKYTILYGNGLTSIESSAFTGCKNISDITIRGLKHLDVNVFENAFTEMSDVKITLENIETIYDRAFAGCTSIKNITIPSSVTHIGNNVFEGCTNLENINVEIGNPRYMSEDGVLFTNPNSYSENDPSIKIGKQLIRYPLGRKGEYTIPEDTLAITLNAFMDCVNLTKVNILSTPTPEGGLATKLVYIGNRAFDGCVFESIDIPFGISTIAERAFANNRSLMKISLPSSVTEVGLGAFSNCDKLESLYVYNDNISLDDILFSENMYGTIKIHANLNSNAHEYAKANGIGFIALNGKSQDIVSGVTRENITVSVIPDNNKHAVANIKDEQISSALANAVAGLKDTINITSQTVSNVVYSIDTVITKNSITLLADDSKINNLTVNNPIAKIKFDKNALSSIKSQATGSNIVISTEIIDINTLPEDIKNQINGNSAFKLNISDGVNNISNFGSGKLSISLPYTLSNSENINLYYMDNVGALIQIVSTYINNMVTFDISNLQDIYIIK